MKKYKLCPCCGKQNVPKMLECVQCETDLSAVRVIDDEMEQKQIEESGQKETVASRMVRKCDCGYCNPVNTRKCESCGEDISDIVPSEEMEEVLDTLHYVFASLDGAYAYKIVDSQIRIGRESVMAEYLTGKPYVSRQHAEITIEDKRLYIENLSKTNYTYVNNIRIPQEKYELQDGDEVGLGGNCQNGNRQKEAAYFLVRIGSCM